MIFFKSINNVFRSKWKSILFIALIFVLTIVLSLGLSVWASVSGFLKDCDESYTTIAVFEYMGTEYPDVDVHDESLQQAAKDFDFSMIEQNENVLLFDRAEQALGYVEGYERTDKLMPRKTAAVLIISRIRPTFANHAPKYLSADIIECISYGYKEVAQYTRIAPLYYDLSENYESGHYYLVHGELGYGSSMYSALTIMPFEQQSAAMAGFTDSEGYMIEDITTDDGGYEIPEDSVFSLIGRTYDVINNSLDVYAVDDINSTYLFNQQESYIIRGREFTAEEYQNGSNVCIVSEMFTKKTGLDVGDTFELNIVVTEGTSVYESYWAGNDFTYTKEYRIVGVTNSNVDFNHNLYIPKADDMSFEANQVGYTLGRAILDNDGADEFYNEMLPNLPDRVRLTIYDQGYGALVKPFKDILRIAKIVTMVCILVSMSVIIFFGFLFVYRQKDVSDIMIKLGAGKKKTILYFLFSTGFIAVISAGLASFASYKLSDYVINFVKNIAANYAMSDAAYSNGSLTIVKEMVFDVNIAYTFFMFAALAVIVSAIICTLGFTLSTFRQKTKKPKKKKKMKAGHTFAFAGRSMKYAVISVLRGGMRTLIVPLLSLAVVLFFFQLSNTAQNYEGRLNQIKQDTQITGLFTDIKGQKANNVVAEAYQINELINSGYIEDLYLSKADYMDYVGRSIVDGEKVELAPYMIPAGFSYQTWVDYIKRGPRLIYTNSIKNSPQFFFTSDVEMEFLEGYDESILGQKIKGTPCCVVSTDYMEEKGIQLGDTIRLFSLSRLEMDLPPEWDFLVVGSYVKEGLKDDIYCQLEAYIDLNLLTRDTIGVDQALFMYTFDSVSFTVKDAALLDEFKAYLKEYGFSSGSEIHTYRTFIVLDDKKFISTVDMLNQQIRYINVLYPILYVLTGVIALVVSYLLAVSRRKEFAIMLGLGAPKRVTFTTFFAEQLFLCIIGGALGVIAGWLIYSAVTQTQLLLALGYILCYMAGCFISISIMNSTKALAILKYED